MFIYLYIVNESYNILYLSFFRYFMRELIPKGAIDVQALPKYFAAWIQKGSDQCIYTAQQLKRYKQPHLHAGCWYLDCVRGFVFDSEAEVKTLHDGGVEVEEDTMQVTHDDEGHEDQSSAPPPKPKRGRQKSVEKTNIRGKNKLNPPSEPEAKIFVSTTRTIDSGSQAPTISRGTKRDSSYDQLSPVINLGDDNESHIDELILNASMNDVLGGSSNDYTSYYKDLKSFMIKVFFFFLLCQL